MTSFPAGNVYRHAWPTRLWHWLNLVCLYVLFTSGLGIFNAHPRLYWGEYGANFDPAWLVLPRFSDVWTLPSYYSLAMSRHWHLTFAPLFAFSLLAYMIWGLTRGHFWGRFHFPRRELSWRHVWREVRDHARLRFDEVEGGRGYNLLQKASYAAILFVVLPLLIASGLVMSPGFNATAPWLLDLLGGRQSGRSIHFICAWIVFGFFLVHVAMVMLSGPYNQMRAMLTGWYRPRGAGEEGERAA